MVTSKRFWASIVVFQLIFGLVVFAVTRSIYDDDRDTLADEQYEIADASIPEADRTLNVSPEMLRSLIDVDPSTADPEAISQLANEYFEDREFPQAAELYEQLLRFSPDNADVLNNLGLTLHYLGRSEEALARLAEGVAMDPKNQRIWLTLGYVNGQTGNIDDARTALTTAIEMNAENQIGQSASDLLKNLGQ